MLTLSIPTPRNADEAAFQARVFDRALRFDLDGYTFEVFANKLYRVFKPENTSKELADYWVDLTAQDCSCKCFAQYGFCKHYLAIERDVLLCEAHERMMADAECGPYGCDPYAEF